MGAAPVAGDRFRRPRGDRSVVAAGHQLQDRARLAAHEAPRGGVHVDPEPLGTLGALGQRGTHGRRDPGAFAGEHEVQLACSQGVGRGQGPVEHEVRAGQGEGGVLGARRLALAEVDHDDRRPAGGGGPQLGREREGRATPAAQPHPLGGSEQLLDGDPGQRPVLRPVRGEAGAASYAVEQGRPGADHDLGRHRDRRRCGPHDDLASVTSASRPRRHSTAAATTVAQPTTSADVHAAAAAPARVSVPMPRPCARDTAQAA